MVTNGSKMCLTDRFHISLSLSLSLSLPPFSLVESCSMDLLRNAVKSFVDMDLVAYRNGTILHVSKAKQLLHVAEDIVEFRC